MRKFKPCICCNKKVDIIGPHMALQWWNQISDQHASYQSFHKVCHMKCYKKWFENKERVVEDSRVCEQCKKYYYEVEIYIEIKKHFNGLYHYHITYCDKCFGILTGIKEKDLTLDVETVIYK